MTHRINRIRLEFKGESSHGARSRQYSINRIRLEFKVKAKLTWTARSAAVLIESDWNLKVECDS